MAVIGIFKQDKDGYSGAIRTLSVDARVRIVANDRRSTSNAPDYRVFIGQMEVGAAWRKTAQENGAYLAVRIDDPSFSEPMRAALLEQPQEGVFRLMWRREKREET
jgi:uncharacterized protein (DUF736 family)